MTSSSSSATTPPSSSSLSTRLRHTFKYTSDTSMDDLSDLDETEQDTLISSLTTSNETTNLFYARVFTGVSLLATLPFLWHLLFFRFTRLTFLPAVLAVTSLAGSAFAMGFLPVGSGGDGRGNGGRDGDGEGSAIGKEKGKGKGYGGYGGYGTAGKGGTLSDVAHAQAERRRAAHVLSGGQLGVELPFVVPIDVQGPVGKWLQTVNAIVGAVLVVFAVLLMDTDAGGQGFWLLLLLPGVIVAVVAVVRSAMGETERGLRELGGLRYDYKGA
jgi:hypothetical protein